jgi:pimeloyl-ACP methyl ester carboxylesterase
MIEKKVLAKGIEVNYKVFGEGRPFLILHGWGSNSGRWQKVAELLAEKEIQSIVPDLPGFGETQEPQVPWSLDNYTDWLYEFTNNVPELQKTFCLLGHSFGGSMAVKFSIKYNQRVEKLFLVSAAALRKQKFSKKAMRNASKVVKVFSFLPGYPLARKAFYKFIIRRSDYPHVREGIMKDTYMKAISEDLSQRLRFVKIPTVIIWGDKDDSTPISDAQYIQQKIRDSLLITLPNVKHSVQLEVPEVLAEKIVENLATV